MNFAMPRTFPIRIALHRPAESGWQVCQPALFRFFSLVLVLWLGFGGAGCQRPKTADIPSAEVSSPLAGTWVATDIYTQDNKKFQELFNARPILTIDAEKGLVSGMSGCNQYMGNMTLDGQSVAIPKGLAVTKRMCVDGMEGEAVYIDLLQKVNHWTMYNPGQLHLLINDMTVLWFEKLN